MEVIRQYTQKGDPRLRVSLSKDLREALLKEAKTNKRRPQDEFARRIAATFQHPGEYRLQVLALKKEAEKIHLQQMHIQMISRDILDLLQYSAMRDGHTLDQEVSLRLQVSFLAGVKMGTLDALSKIKHKRFTLEELEAERMAALPARKRRYELEKLELMLRFPDCVSEEEKKSFTSIDPTKEKRAIRKRLRAENR